MDHQTLGQWDNRPSDPAYYVEDCQPKHPSPTINNNVQLNVHKHYRRFPMTVHTILPAIGHPDHVPYIITFAFAGHGRRKKSLLLRINMYRSAVLPVNSSCDTITYFPLAQHAETLKVVLIKVQNSENPFSIHPNWYFIKVS